MLIFDEQSNENSSVVNIATHNSTLSLSKAFSSILKSVNDKVYISNLLCLIHQELIKCMLTDPMARLCDSDFLPSPEVSDAVDKILCLIFKCLQQLTLPSGRSAVGSPFIVEDAKSISKIIKKTIETQYDEILGRLTGASLELWREEYQRYLRAVESTPKNILNRKIKVCSEELVCTGTAVDNDEFPATPVIKRARRN
jgi:hypothetical protein